ncbi:MarR family winged helix-turn-helix transcriptional regulator [Mycobacterium scrofulaceum]|uniref:MarR family transcriptional regulator n=1 Tax=Mycobacterium scrofulaceum TaxID=1783 RepID=A0A1X0KFS8_MYCSC|nr:MarR family transcriptional regulator [Mycobacterium scrofulaceum]ORB73894.1 MarR family transcriptional regulator [Mycobacterium scrofulaceum]
MADYTERMIWLVKRAEMATQQAKERTLRRHKITGAQHAALTIINLYDGITSAELARRCFVTAQTMNSTVSRLEAAKLVARTAHPLHRNLIELRLTEHGRQVYARADAEVAALDDQLAAGFAAAELRALKRALTHIAAVADEASSAQH